MRVHTKLFSLDFFFPLFEPFEDVFLFAAFETNPMLIADGFFARLAPPHFVHDKKGPGRPRSMMKVPSFDLE